MKGRLVCVAGGLITAAVAGCVLYGLFGVRKTNWRAAEPGTVLVDYYEATRATVGGDRYLEFVLRKTEAADTVGLEVYRGGEKKEESCVLYTVPMEVVERCFEIIDGKKLHKWNEMYDGAGLGGGMVVCRFFDGEQQIRVSTDCMPENGEGILRDIGRVIAGYQGPEYQTE